MAKPGHRRARRHPPGLSGRLDGRCGGRGQGRGLAPEALECAGLPAPPARTGARTRLRCRRRTEAVRAGGRHLTSISCRDSRQVLMVVFNKSETGRRLDAARFAESIGQNTRARDVLGGSEFELASGISCRRRARPSSSSRAHRRCRPASPGRCGRSNASNPASSMRAASTSGCRRPTGRMPARRYPVLYMHDGQNLFDPALSYIGVDWGLDEAITRLAAEGRVREAIVVGIWNTPKRFAEYMPAKAITESGLPGDWPDMAWMRRQEIVSDDYLRFIVEELKPRVDATYRTLPGREDTSIMGSSMGALISLYALTEYPEVFGAAGCVSIHWPLGDGIVADYLVRHLPAAGPQPLLLRPRDGDARCRLCALPAARGCACSAAAGWREGRDFLTCADIRAPRTTSAPGARASPCRSSSCSGRPALRSGSSLPPGTACRTPGSPAGATCSPSRRCTARSSGC